MCGRYVLATDIDAIQREFDLSAFPPLDARYNIAPTQPVPIITNERGRQVDIVLWGLIPSWSKDTSIATKLINARAETVDEKPSFRAAFKYRRCLIPATGFYEWMKAEKGTKRPHLLHLPQRPVFAFAGLWERWQSPQGDELRTCTILTTEPNDLVRPLHHRMAVILNREDYELWLDPASDPGHLKSLLQPYPGEEMALYEVSTLVNNVRNDHPDLITPLQTPRQSSLL